MKGTMDFNDIYPNLGTATAGDDQHNTKTGTNAATAMDPISEAPGQSGIMKIKGGFLGQPITVWLGIIGLLVVVKFLMERE